MRMTLLVGPVELASFDMELVYVHYVHVPVEDVAVALCCCGLMLLLL